jgi:hypothetical protein
MRSQRSDGPRSPIRTERKGNLMKTISQPERKLTELERADEAARMARALIGQLRPRTLHAICEQSARLIPCPHCGARHSRTCPGGYHLARFVEAYVAQLVTAEEMARVIQAAGDVFTLATIIRDGTR